MASLLSKHELSTLGMSFFKLPPVLVLKIWPHSRRNDFIILLVQGLLSLTNTHMSVLDMTLNKLMVRLL